MAASPSTLLETPDAVKRGRTCRFYFSWRGCRDGDECLYKHSSDAPKCKYYFSKWGCWNEGWCRFRHSEDEEETPAEPTDTAHQFYAELNKWLGPAKTADDSILSVASDALSDAPRGPNPAKKYVSRGTQTKATPDFVHCGECGEEFKSGRNLQQSLERHYIHKLASADFHHLRFFRSHPELRRNDPFCAACGEVFGSVESLLQHMGSRVSSSTTLASVRAEHQDWFKQLVQPFVYRDLEVIDTDENITDLILEIYFAKGDGKSSSTGGRMETIVKTPTLIKKPTKINQDVNNNESKSSTYVHCAECGEIFNEPDSDRKLHTHYCDMLTRADGLHVWMLKTFSKVDSQAYCSACKKSFMSMVALLQHLGSKQKVTNSNPRPLAARHVSLLDDIADIFVGRDLGVEGYTKDTLVTKLVELLAPEGPGHPNEVLTSDDEARSSPVKENHDDALQMARYFCRVNEWQAKMSYPEYVKDDQERTRNHGFTVGEVEYLESKHITPTSQSAFRALNAIYKRRKKPLRSLSSRKYSTQFSTQSSIQEEASSDVPADDEKDGVFPSKSVKVAKESEVKEKGGKSKEKGQEEGEGERDQEEAVDEGGDKAPRALAPKPKRKRVRRRRKSRAGSTDQEDLAPGQDDATKDTKPKSSKPSASVSQKGEGSSASKTLSKRERIQLAVANRGQDQAVSHVVFQVRIDGTTYIRFPSAESEEEVLNTSGKDDSMLEKSVALVLHSEIQIPRKCVFVVHTDGIIDVTLPGYYDEESGSTEKLGSAKLGSEKPVSEKSCPEKPVSEKSGSEKCDPEKSVSEKSGPNKLVPEKSGPETAVSENAGGSKKSDSEKCIPEKSVSEKAIPKKSGQETSVPEMSGSEKSVPAKPVPEKPVPEKSAPEKSVPEKSVPEKAIKSTEKSSAPQGKEASIKKDQDKDVPSGELEEVKVVAPPEKDGSTSQKQTDETAEPGSGSNPESKHPEDDHAKEPPCSTSGEEVRTGDAIKGAEKEAGTCNGDMHKSVERVKEDEVKEAAPQSSPNVGVCGPATTDHSGVCRGSSQQAENPDQEEFHDATNADWELIEDRMNGNVDDRTKIQEKAEEEKIIEVNNNAPMDKTQTQETATIAEVSQSDCHI